MKKYTWLVYKRDDSLCIVKSVQKLTDWARGCRAEIFKILYSVDIMVFKNTKWPTCVYMIKNITQTVVIYFNQATKAEDRIVAMILCLVCSTCYLSQGYGTHAQRSGSCLAIIITATFLDGSLLYVP